MATVKDVVCGMMIDSESAAARSEVAGQVFYFCSAECATVFETNPERYAPQTSAVLESADEPLEQHEPPYTTLGFLTSPKFGAAGSGGLEYERLPEAHDRKPT
jgi:YHS domain-containing protein